MRDEDAPDSYEFRGPDNGGWSTTQSYDWVALCPGIKDVDYRLYMIVRSLLSKWSPVRKITPAELCQLLLAPDGSPSSLTRIRDCVRRLTAVGLFTTPDGDVLTTSSRVSASAKPVAIQVNDLPETGYEGWRNAYDALQTIRADAGRNSDPAPDAGQNSDPVGRKNDPVGRNSDPSGQNSDPHPAADLGKPDPSSCSPSCSPSLSPSGGEPAADTDPTSAPRRGDERENPTGTEEGPDATSFAVGLPGVGESEARGLAPLVVTAFARGWRPEALREYLTSRCDLSRVSFPPSVYGRHLRDIGPPPADGARRRGPWHACPVCKGSGLAEDGEGNPVGKCPCPDRPVAA